MLSMQYDGLQHADLHEVQSALVQDLRDERQRSLPEAVRIQPMSVLRTDRWSQTGSVIQNLAGRGVASPRRLEGIRHGLR
jgi:hypothetical protein